MVIHDMKNPTGATLIGLQQTKECLEKIIREYESHLNFNQSNGNIHNNLRDDNVNQLSILCREFSVWLQDFRAQLDQFETELIRSIDQIDTIIQMTPQ